MSKPVSIISALFCTLIWGTTFIAQETGMEKIGPYTFNAVRFFVGFIALIPFYLILEKTNTKRIIPINTFKRQKKIYLSFSIDWNFFIFSFCFSTSSIDLYRCC